MSQRPKFDYDIIIIGSGAGGSPAASIAARAGKRVAVVEKSTLGGESPNWGDVPLGALLHVANTYTEAKASAKFGLRTGHVGYNYPSLLSWKDTVIKRTGAGGNRSYYEKQGISVFSGNAHFLSPNEIAINRRHLSARKFLIATGSHWCSSDIPGIDDVSYHTPKTILKLTKLPKTLFIVGSGVTALEIAYFFAAFGTKAYVAETAQRILPTFDSEVADHVMHESRRHGIAAFTRAKVISAQKSGLQKRVIFIQGGRERSVRVDEILIADQRQPALDLGLENAGVKYSSDGIEVSPAMQTSAKHIFAVGGAIDADAQTHEVLSQSRTAAHNLLHRNQITIGEHTKLSTVCIWPQIAQTGLNGDDCLKRDLHVNTAIVPLTLTTRSNVTDRGGGFVKLISDKKGTLLGATVVAPHANDMIAELTLAVRHQLNARQLMTTPHDFMSWSEAVRIAAGKLL